MPMIQAFISSQRAAATAAAFILTYFVALTLGRFFKRRAQVPLGLFFQTFCLTLAFYAAITVYGVQADWRKHVGAALVFLVLLSSSLSRTIISGTSTSKRSGKHPSRTFCARSLPSSFFSSLFFSSSASAITLKLSSKAFSRVRASPLSFSASPDKTFSAELLPAFSCKLAGPFGWATGYRLANASPKLW